MAAVYSTMDTRNGRTVTATGTKFGKTTLQTRDLKITTVLTKDGEYTITFEDVKTGKVLRVVDGRYPEPETEKLTLREALSVAQDAGSVVPGAVLRNSYVYYDEEHERWMYVPDINDPLYDVTALYDDELDLAVDESLSTGWTPVGNFIY